jgi:hemerythrin
LSSSERTSVSAAFQWHASYAVGVEEIDADHRHLFRLAGRFQQAMLDGAGRDMLEDLLSALVAYTCQHFAHEEGYMRKIGYPGFDAHRRQHQELRARVADMRQRAAGGEVLMTIAVLEFLTGSIRAHIVACDSQIGAYQRQLTRYGTASRTPPPR